MSAPQFVLEVICLLSCGHRLSNCCGLQGAGHVGNARLPIIHHDRESTE